MEFYYFNNHFTTIMQGCYNSARLQTPYINCHILVSTLSQPYIVAVILLQHSYFRMGIVIIYSVCDIVYEVCTIRVLMFLWHGLTINIIPIVCVIQVRISWLAHLDNINFLSRIDLLCFIDCYYYSGIGLPCTKHQKVAIYKFWNYYCQKVQKWIVWVMWVHIIM